ncbi:MAG: hypothetical protein WCF57_02010 [Pyrinomonadaceae bacterium]
MSEEQVVAPTIQQEQIPEMAELTWGIIIKKFYESLKLAGKEKQERNFKTAINFFLEAIGLTEDSPVGTELAEEFKAKIEVYITFQTNRGLEKSTYGPRVSKIKALKRFVDKNFADKLQLQTLPKTFGQRLRRLITALGFTIMSFWRTLPDGLVGYNTLLAWCNERKIPSRGWLKAIETIEFHLNIPPGTLRPPKYLLRGHNLKIGHSDFGNKTQALSSKPYFVWTRSLEEEFQRLFFHKTTAILPDGEERHEKGQWTSSEGAGVVASADIVEGFLKSFMGYCALPQGSSDPYLRGEGIKLESLSLALLADKKLIENFIEFKRLRSGLRRRPATPAILTSALDYNISTDKRWEFYSKGGKYNRGSLMVLGYISSFLRPGTGYLYQHSEFAEKLGSRMTAANWHDQCTATRDRVEKLRRQIKKMKTEGDQENYDFGHDPKEQIQWILDLPRPFIILQGMVKAMLDDLLPETATMFNRARQYRDIVLVALLCANPLRIRMFSIMEFEKHLIRQSDGSWWLRFKKGAFKNRRALKSDYVVKVAEEIWPLLDRYKKDFHPFLAGASKSKHVFLGDRTRKHGRPLSTDMLSLSIRELTELYIPGAIGFRPHAFRHIIATDIIRKDPRLGFFIASRALHDKFETVEAEYAHLKTSEFFEAVNIHFSEMWGSVFGSSQQELKNQNIGLAVG